MKVKFVILGQEIGITLKTGQYVLIWDISIPAQISESMVQSMMLASAYLPGVEVNRDHEGGSSRARPFHCTSVGLTPTITPNVGNSNA